MATRERRILSGPARILRGHSESPAVLAASASSSIPADTSASARLTATTRSWRYSPMALAEHVGLGQPLRRLGEGLRQPWRALGLRQQSRVGGDGRGQREPAVYAVDAGRDQAAEREVGIGGTVHRLPLEVSRPGSGRPAGALEAQGRLAILVSPARIRPGPVRRYEARVGQRRGIPDRRKRRELIQNPGQEGLPCRRRFPRARPRL